MRKLKALVTGVLLTTLAFSMLPVQSARADFTECAIGTVCVFKDVFNDAQAAWNNNTTNGVPGEYHEFNIGVWNTTAGTINNVTFRDTLPAGLTFTTGSIQFAGWSGSYNEADLFNGTGINVGSLTSGQSVQLAIRVSIDPLPAGVHNLTNSATVSWTGGSKSNSAQIVVTSTGLPAEEGDLLINEINHNPQADWSGGSSYALSNRTAIDADDEWIEVYVTEAGLDLTDSNWTLTIANNGGASSTTQLLATGTGYEYFGSGSVSNTAAGAYLLINNPLLDLNDTASIGIDFDSSAIDSMSYSGTPSGLLDETVGRNASSTDTGSNSDFSRNHATPGMVNDVRSATRYEAEIYMASGAGNEHGEDERIAAASRGLAVKLDSSVDLAGDTFSVISNAHQSAGAYRADLRIRTNDAILNDFDSKFADFVVAYPNGSGGYKETGFAIVGRDFSSNGTFQTLSIEFVKPATSGNNIYQMNFFPAAGVNVVVDYIEVTQISPSNALPQVFQAEDMHKKAGSVFNDGGTTVVLGNASEISGIPVHVAYGPYTAKFHTGLNSQQLEASFRLKFANVTGTGNDVIARIEVTNPTQGLNRETFLRASDVSGSYADYKLQFPTASEGSFQFRVMNFGNADIFFDSVTVNSLSGLPVWVYETENDFDLTNNGVIQDNAAASGGQEVVTTVAANDPGHIQMGPFTLDQTGTGEFYKATYRVRTTGTPSSSDIAALMIVREFDTARIIANGYIYANTLNSDYREFEVIFQSFSSGRNTYELYFNDVVDVISDSVTVEQLAANPDPREIQAESLYREGLNGDITEDALATNAIGHTTGLAVIAQDGVDDGKIIVYSNSQEMFAAGNYEAAFSLRKTGPGSSSAPVMYVEVFTPFNQIGYVEVSEADLSTGGYTDIVVPFNLGSSERIYYKIYFVGGTGNNILVDKITLDKV
ncbi:MAG: hypothetical protein TR69_WS6001000818 [candidate division WS6 bacterium OLB20]|uniref:DUF11 domain-containing protein n=1 Tax=candidate division WS6 bacterium OLB20 TaxID=1617426 RepID=A0A136LYX6_9BACT|nr:MAG: hypothetical protein TR69_WS6001000818 [candidate division WS6 bacterium OLB20]